MSKSKIIQLEKKESHQTGGVKRVFTTLGLTLVWVFLSALAIGCLAAAIWTVIPTDLLSWGASRTNLLGYVSHCSYAPISTFVLSSTSLVGFGCSYKLKRGRDIGKVVYAGTTGGLLVGLLGGIDIVMYIGMGIGVGVAVVLGFIMGIYRQAKI